MELSLHFRTLARGQMNGEALIAPLVCSDLREEHSIYGGADRLRQCIDYAIEHYAPGYLFIANSCVSGVIGDDSEAVAREASEKWNIPIFAIPDAGFLDGDYYRGFYQTGKIVAERLLQPKPQLPNTVTLLGDRGGPHSEEATELTELLASIGLRVISHFPCYLQSAENSLVAASAFSASLAGTGQSHQWLCKLGAILEDRFGTRQFKRNHPVGFQDTVDWLTEFACFAGLDSFVAAAVEGQRLRLQPELAEFADAVRKTEIVFCIGRPLAHFDPCWVLELFQLAGIAPPSVVILEAMAEKDREAITEKLIACGATIVDRNRSDAALAQAKLLLTTHELAGDYNRQIFLPLLPPVGVSATLALLRAIMRLLRRRGTRGGLLYV